MLLCESLFVDLKWMQWVALPSSTFGETCKTELCNPKLRWKFIIKCMCQLIFILVFKNVTWLFGFEVECQMKFVKHAMGPLAPIFLPLHVHRGTLISAGCSLFILASRVNPKFKILDCKHDMPSIVKWQALINETTRWLLSSDKAFFHLPRHNLKTLPTRISPSVYSPKCLSRENSQYTAGI